MTSRYKHEGAWSIGKSTRLSDGQEIWAFRRWGKVVWAAFPLDGFYPTKAACRAALDARYLAQHYNDNPPTVTGKEAEP